jgi:hypothetical protein
LIRPWVILATGCVGVWHARSGSVAAIVGLACSLQLLLEPALGLSRRLTSGRRGWPARSQEIL